MTDRQTIFILAAFVGLAGCNETPAGTSGLATADNSPAAMMPIDGNPPPCDDVALERAVRFQFDEMQATMVESGRTVLELGRPRETGFARGNPDAAYSGFESTRWCGWDMSLDNGERGELYAAIDAKPGAVQIRLLCPTIYASRYQDGPYDCTNTIGPKGDLP
ncbi:hypothetical protein GC169_11595 [bacterium]|nr:hypothetical protein [bacterium]